MQPTYKEIAEQFSKGNFSFCYSHFGDEVEWKIIGSDSVKGKNEVIAQCEKMTTEIGSSTLNNLNTISENELIAIEGNCHYIGPDEKAGEVRYCDVYRFENSKIASITSYCIDTKVK